MAAFEIRVMTPADIPQFRRMMATHNDFEGMPDMALTESDLHERAFGPAPEYGAFVADGGSEMGPLADERGGLSAVGWRRKPISWIVTLDFERRLAYDTRLQTGRAAVAQW
jgi:hypothetical protein